MKWTTTFLVLSVSIASVVWYWTDWWVYVDNPSRGLTPKFELTIAEQLIISSVLGALAGGLITAACRFVAVCLGPRDFESKD